MNPFFEAQGRLWAAAAARRGARIDPPAMDSDIALELLELARVAAHTRERRFAPLSCYLAGVAAERLRAAQPDTDDSAIANLIEEVRKQLEADETLSS